MEINAEDRILKIKDTYSNQFTVEMKNILMCGRISPQEKGFSPTSSYPSSLFFPSQQHSCTTGCKNSRQEQITLIGIHFQASPANVYKRERHLVVIFPVYSATWWNVYIWPDHLVPNRVYVGTFQIIWTEIGSRFMKSVGYNVDPTRLRKPIIWSVETDQIYWPNGNNRSGANSG